MGSKRFLFTFGLAGGLLAGIAIGLVMMAVTGQPDSFPRWAALIATSMGSFILGGWLTWFQWAQARAKARSQVIAQLAQGDLSARNVVHYDNHTDVRRLVLSLRRAISQVQRVTANVHRTCQELGGQARGLLDSARRQGTAVERTLTAVDAMGQSLQSSGKRVVQLDEFAQDTTSALSEMTERMGQVASALGTLDEFAHKTSEAVAEMSERLSAVALSGDGLARFAVEAEDFVAAVEGGIDAVKRRANETGDLARVVTSTAERGEALVNDSVAGMYRVEETVSKAAEIVDLLGKRSQEIRRIVDVIQEVADQTHLLALNASIIASQAGEHGRAFGVVADAVRGLAERTARSTREIATLVTGVRREVDTAVTLVSEGREKAREGVQLGDRAASALKEIRSITQRTFSAVEATMAETARLQSQGEGVVEASQRVVHRVREVTAGAVAQAAQGRELVRQTQEMARLAQSASEKAEGQARTGRDLSDSVLRLTAAIDEIRAAQGVLTRGDSAISEEVAQVREDARTVIRIADGLSRTVDQLGHEASGLEEEVFRFRLPATRRGGTLRVGLHQSDLEETHGLDPLFTLDSQLAEVGANLYSNLLRSEDGGLVPGLAERWETSPSARRYRFFLQRNVQFHDGRMLTAHDVKRHFERLLDPQVGSADQWIFREVEGAMDFIAGNRADVAGFEILDEHALEIRLEEPKAFFLHLVTLPATQIARVDPNGHPVGTGPFRVARMDSKEIALERNPHYFRADQPLLDRLEFELYRDQAEAVEHLLEGAVDMVSGLHAEHVGRQDLGDNQVVAGTMPSCWFLAFNLDHAPFNDVRVRKAVRAGLDLEALVERFHPGATLARTVTPPSILSGVDRLPMPRPDVALAQRLLRDVGLSKLRLDLPFPPGRDTRREDAVLFKPLLDAGLLELSHIEMGANEFWQKAREGRLACFRSGWYADYPDPDNFLHFLLHSSAQTVFALAYRDEEVDRLTAEARISIDPEHRADLYRNTESRMAEAVPLIPLYHERIYALANPSVQALRLHPIPPQVRFENLWWDPA